MKDKIMEFAKVHKTEILAWQAWLRKQSGKMISEIDWASEPKLFEPKKKRGKI